MLHRPSTGTPDMKESYQIGWGEQLAPAWPSEEDFPGFKKQCKEFMQAVHTLSEKLLLCFSEALELGDTLAKEHDVTRDGVLAALRLLHYPDVTGQDFPSNYWRAGEVLLADDAVGKCTVSSTCLVAYFIHA
jgi:hypothetical protein